MAMVIPLTKYLEILPVYLIFRLAWHCITSAISALNRGSFFLLPFDTVFEHHWYWHTCLWDLKSNDADVLWRSFRLENLELLRKFFPAIIIFQVYYSIADKLETLTRHLKFQKTSDVIIVARHPCRRLTRGIKLVNRPYFRLFLWLLHTAAMENNWDAESQGWGLCVTRSHTKERGQLWRVVLLEDNLYIDKT